MPCVLTNSFLQLLLTTDYLIIVFSLSFSEVDGCGIGRRSLGQDLSSVATYHTRGDSYLPGLDRVLLAVVRRLGQEGSVQASSAEDVHAPLIAVLAQIMLHFLEEWQVFALLHHLMTRSAWLDLSHTHSSASHLTLVTLIHTHAVSEQHCNHTH